jgi:predicted SAM-dependent methyltransferase
LEIGTGWIHWFGLYLAMHAEKIDSIDLYDVWDNRQLKALLTSFGELAKRWDKRSLPEFQSDRMQRLLAVTSFEELYKEFQASYTVDQNGSLASYQTSSYDLVFSFHVLEHIGRDIINASVADIYRTLKPGGYTIHQIGIDDHLSHYDKSESPKKYISYSMAMRKRIFENVVQYHNVLQASDYIKIFQEQGFEVLELDRERTNISSVSVNKDWQGYSQDDLETTILTMVCRKPLD